MAFGLTLWYSCYRNKVLEVIVLELTCITKAVDDSGRVQIPKSILDELGISVGDELTVATFPCGVAFIKK